MRELGLLQDRTRTGQEAGVSSEEAAAELKDPEPQAVHAVVPVVSALYAPAVHAVHTAEVLAAARLA